MTISPRPPRPLVALLLGTIAVSAQQGSKVSGRVVASDGRKLLSAAVILTGVDEASPTIPAEDVTIMPDGRFIFGRVPPGRYQVRARAQTQANGLALFATFGLVVGTRDVVNVTMTLQPGVLLDGHVTIQSRRRNVTAPPLTSLTVRAPLTDGSGFGDALTGRVTGDGTFAVRGLVPGLHHIFVDGLPDGWTVEKVIARGQDLMDRPFEVAGQPLQDIRVTIADSASQLTGDVHDAQDRAVADVPVMVFSVSPQFWIRGGRRLRIVRTDSQGQFVLRGLPAGAYLAVASAGLDRARKGWTPNDVEAYRAGSTPVDIASDDARAAVHLRLAASPADK